MCVCVVVCMVYVYVMYICVYDLLSSVMSACDVMYVRGVNMICMFVRDVCYGGMLCMYVMGVYMLCVNVSYVCNVCMYVL